VTDKVSQMEIYGENLRVYGVNSLTRLVCPFNLCWLLQLWQHFDNFEPPIRCTNYFKINI